MLRYVPPPLASANLKMIRAQEHLDPLVAEIRRWELSHPYRVVRETDFETGEHVAYGVLQDPPGDAWYGPFGDVVSNLHAALDHAVFGFSEYGLGRELTDREARLPGWPVVPDVASWERFLRQGAPAIRFLEPAYREIVEREQPYRRAHERARRDDAMWLLHALWNVDKHRKVGYFGVVGHAVAAYVPGDPQPAFRVSPPVVDHGTEVVRVPVGAIHAKEQLEPLIEVEVTLEQRGLRPGVVPGVPRIRDRLEEMHLRVFGVLSEFAEVHEGGAR